MDVHALERGPVEDRLAENLPVRDHDQKIRARSGEVPGPQSLGLQQRQIMGECERLDGAGDRAFASLAGSVGLGDDSLGNAARSDQRGQMARGKVGRARENERRRQGSGPLLLLFDELLADELALRIRQVVDEQLALQVVHLVLNANREHAVGVEF